MLIDFDSLVVKFPCFHVPELWWHSRKSVLFEMHVAGVRLLKEDQKSVELFRGASCLGV